MAGHGGADPKPPPTPAKAGAHSQPTNNPPIYPTTLSRPFSDPLILSLSKDERPHTQPSNPSPNTYPQTYRNEVAPLPNHVFAQKKYSASAVFG